MLHCLLNRSLLCGSSSCSHSSARRLRLFVQISGEIGDVDALGGLLTAFHSDNRNVDLPRQGLPQKLLHRQVTEVVVADRSTGMTARPSYWAIRISRVFIVNHSNSLFGQLDEPLAVPFAPTSANFLCRIENYTRLLRGRSAV